jgi:uncharacterized protein YjlB
LEYNNPCDSKNRRRLENARESPSIEGRQEEKQSKGQTGGGTELKNMATSNPHTPPEQYHVHTPTDQVPNSRFSVLIYRSVLGLSQPEEDLQAETASSRTIAKATARAAVERNHWRYGGTFKTYWKHHFHSVTHECYAVVGGRSRLLLGVGPPGTGSRGEGDGQGETVELIRGDVIILPVRTFRCLDS